MWSAKKTDPLMINNTKAIDMDKEMVSPVFRTDFPLEAFDATICEMAVWMEPAQIAKQIP